MESWNSSPPEKWMGSKMVLNFVAACVEHSLAKDWRFFPRFKRKGRKKRCPKIRNNDNRNLSSYEQLGNIC